MLKKIKWRLRGILEYTAFRNRVLRLVLSARHGKSQENTGQFRVSFMSGCGRSGTTLLGKILDLHSSTLFFDEPRARWTAINPKTDIWGYTGCTAESFLMEGEAQSFERKRFRSLFRPGLNQGKILNVIEKTPENIFRVAWLNSLHQDARFVHIVRNGNDVVRSILAKAGEDVPYGVSDMNNWYGRKGIKIGLLKITARQLGLEEGVVAGCKTHTDYAALEWVCSQLAYEAALQRYGSQKILLIRYESILDQPWEVFETLRRFIGLDDEPRVKASLIDLVRKNFRQSPFPDMCAGLKPLYQATMDKLGYEITGVHQSEKAESVRPEPTN